MTAAHPSQPGYVPARLIAAASAHRGRHKAGLWSPFEERHVAMLQSETGVHATSGRFCNGCLTYYLTSPLRTAPCTKCGQRFEPARELIQRFERIKP